MKEDKIRKHIIFRGRVQGVGFRYYAVQKARELGLTGWVQNLDDGTVEMEVQGLEGQIDQLVLFLDRRRYISIEGMDCKRRELENEREFRERGCKFRLN
ncbi:MAG: acylphosphatase [Lachnospiraceae bacterium]|nr:acylphosphatase [Lachnospiraceae bacterium]